MLSRSPARAALSFLLVVVPGIERLLHGLDRLLRHTAKEDLWQGGRTLRREGPCRRTAREMAPGLVEKFQSELALALTARGTLAGARRNASRDSRFELCEGNGGGS